MSGIRRMIEESDERGQTSTDVKSAAEGVTTPDLVLNTSTESTTGNGDNHNHLNGKLSIFGSIVS